MMTKRKLRFFPKRPNAIGYHIRIHGGIGFKAPSITGEEKEFWWWQNFSSTLKDLKAGCRALLSKHHMEAQIGPAVDIDKSFNARPKKVHIVPRKQRRIITGTPFLVYGVYVESSKHIPSIMAFYGHELTKEAKEAQKREKGSAR